MSRATATRARGSARRWATAAVTTLALLAAPLGAAQATHADESDPGEPGIYLVTLNGPGTTGHPRSGSREAAAQEMFAEQQQLLAAVNAPEPIYQWTTALNGFAVELDAEQARTLSGNPRVAQVEKNAVRPLSTLDRATRQASATPTRAARGGAGTVIGFVDSGIDPGNRAFSDVTPLGASPRYRGECTATADDPTWKASACGAKVVGAQYFVAGYGDENVRSGDSLSPRDTNGHGTQMASIAAGSAGVPVRVAGHRFRKQPGTAPRARIAAYKACWSAPNPADDGCATADLVAAIDQATEDRVDVLNISVAGPTTIDTVERALLGATEGGVVVIAAAGNKGSNGFAAHPTPWVVTVGATTGATRSGVVRAGDETFRGRMASGKAVTDAPLVFGADVAAPGADPRAARLCRSGSLDASEVAGSVVVCERGETGRVAKSRAVERADGLGMILVNATRDASVNADLHAVPTVHITLRAARALQRWADSRARPRVSLEPRGLVDRRPRLAGFSSIGNPRLSILKPDVVAPGTELLAAVPGGWDLATGTSASAATVSGIAATMLAEEGATPGTVRSALLTTTRPIDDSDVGQTGAGLARNASLPPLSYLVPERHYRAWLEERRSQLNQAHAVLDGEHARVTRTVTNTSDRIIRINAATEGFSEAVRVYPSWAELAPGDELTFTVTLPNAQLIEQGTVVWRTPGGPPTRLTVVATR